MRCLGQHDVVLSVLLGAGASIEAGLPTAIQLTDRMISGVHTRSFQQLLEFVRRSMEAHRATQTPVTRLSGIDSESLFNTVSDLVYRDDLEISPFVLNWHPSLAALGDKDERVRELESQIKRSFQSTSGFRSHDLAKAIVEGSKGYSVPHRVLDEMRFAVIQSLTPTRPLDYLKPLAKLATRSHERGHLSIATLNYDTCIERVCEMSGVEYSDGIRGYDEPLEFGESKIRLYKLHGSVTWARSRNDISAIEKTDGQPRFGTAPRVLFGGKNKLTADWPFFDVFWSWREELNKSSTLLVIGYSFRDDHVNAVITRWMSSDESRRIILVSPSPIDQHGTKHPLYWLYRQSSNKWPDQVVAPETGRTDPGLPGRPRLIQIEESTSQALERLNAAATWQEAFELTGDFGSDEPATVGT